MQVLEQPSEDAGCGVVRREDDSDNVICYLGINDFPALLTSLFHEINIQRIDCKGLEKFKDDFLDLRDGGAESGGQERGEDQLLELGMIGSLMKEERFWSNDLLFAGRICGLKEMSLADQDDPSCFGTGYHHASTPQYVVRAYNNDYVCLLPLETVGEEGVGIFGVELESFPEGGGVAWLREVAQGEEDM
nr:hypothetical protein Iba_chr12dCG17780 [Ipomoea batatas]